MHGIEATVYEAEESAGARTQGGMLDIHDYNGQLALRATGLMEEFRKIIHVGGEASRMLDPRGNVLLDQPDDGRAARPEVPRGDLRRILLDSLPMGAVRWGCKLVSLRTLEDGQHTLSFENGLNVSARLVIGADGAWSRVRSLLSGVKPAYTGVSFVETYLFDADTRHPASASAVGGGSLYALTPGKGIVAHREPNGVLHTYVVLARPQEWFDRIDFADSQAAKTRIASELEGWAPELVSLIADGDTAPVLRKIHSLPIGHRWQPIAGVTLLGDAAHLAPPDGEGANLAMLDAAELGKAIAAHPDNVEAALAEYETGMFARSTTAAVEAEKTFRLCFQDDDVPHGLLEFFKAAND